MQIKFTQTLHLLRSPYIILLTIGVLNVAIMWPGMFAPDSMTQYSMVISGIYSDHHPALMSFVWRYLDLIHKGPGLMFCLHLGFFYSAIYYLMHSIRNQRYRYLLLAVPLLPQIMVYSNIILKDVAYTFCFLFVNSYLAYLTANKRKLTWGKLLLVLTILIYGTAVKFQAKYCAPIVLAWITLARLNYKLNLNYKFAKHYSILLLIFYLLLNSINYMLVPNSQQSHSWQFVKIYDLAAISMATKQDLLPNFTKNNNFSMQELHNKLHYTLSNKQKFYMVDELIYAKNPILHKGVTELERQELYTAWLNAVKQHPILYLKHRGLNVLSMLIYHPAFKHIPTFFYSNQILLNIVYGLIYLTMSNLLPITLSLAYLLFGIYLLKKHSYQISTSNWYAIPLIGFNSISVIMLTILFFCSMAGTPRYTYIAICMAHASHIFAYLGFKQLSQVS